MCFSLTPAINVATEEENSTMNIISRGTSLTCTPIVSCDVMDVSIMWSVSPDYNETMLNDTSLSVKARQYGNYTCTVAARIGGMANLLYELYGKTYSVYGSFMNPNGGL